MEEKKANLGLATTRELLDELRARIEVDGKLDYSTVSRDGDGSAPGELVPFEGPVDNPEFDEPKRVLPTDKRVVRTKTSGDRVFLLDEEKRTRQWVTTPSLLEELGFKLEDVGEVEESELLKYQMATPLHKT